MSTILTEAIQPVIACVASVAAFAWKSSERQRGRWREQHSAISAVLGRDLASVHDLEIESMSRVCFGRAIPAAELRTLASAGYSLPQLEAYAVARSLCE